MSTFAEPTIPADGADPGAPATDAPAGDTPAIDVPAVDAPAVEAPAVVAPAGPRSNRPADRFMRRLLRLPEGRTATAAEARSLFQKSLLISSCRCLLMYIVLPFVLPAVGIARGVGPAIGLVIGLLAIVAITYSIRRFWRADHSKRWHYTVFGTTIIGFMIYLAILDVADLVG